MAFFIDIFAKTLYNNYMKKIFLIVVMMFIVLTCTHCIDFAFNMGAGITVGDRNSFYGGLVHSFVFDKDMLDGQPMDSTIQIILGFREAVFGYGCVLRHNPNHTTEEFEAFDTIMSLGYNFKLTPLISTLLSFNLTSRNTLGVSFVVMFDIGPFIR